MTVAAPLLMLATFAAVAAAMGGGSSTARASSRTSPRLPSSTTPTGPLCSTSPAALPLDDLHRVRRWAACAGRTAAQVQALRERATSSGHADAGTAAQTSFDRAQRIAREAPSPTSVSPATRAAVERATTTTDTQARTLPVEPAPSSADPAPPTTTTSTPSSTTPSTSPVHGGLASAARVLQLALTSGSTGARRATAIRGFQNAWNADRPRRTPQLRVDSTYGENTRAALASVLGTAPAAITPEHTAPSTSAPTSPPRTTTSPRTTTTTPRTSTPSTSPRSSGGSAWSRSRSTSSSASPRTTTTPEEHDEPTPREGAPVGPTARDALHAVQSTVLNPTARREYIRRFQAAMATAAREVGDPRHGLAHVIVTSSWHTDGVWDDDTRRAIAHVLSMPAEQIPREPVPYHGHTTTSTTHPSTTSPSPAPSALHDDDDHAPPSMAPSSHHTSPAPSALHDDDHTGRTRGRRTTTHPSGTDMSSPVIPEWSNPPPSSSAHETPPHPGPAPFVPADQMPTAEDTAAGHAHDLYTEGQRHFSAGEFAEALTAYQQSHTVASAAHLATAPTALLAISLTQERLGHNPEAIAALRQYLTDAPNAPDRAAIAERLAGLEQDAELFAPSTPSTHTASAPTRSSTPTTTVPGDGDWYREVRTASHGTQRYVVHPEDAQHLAPELAQYLAAAGSRYDQDRVRVFQRAAGIAPAGEYGGTTRAALIFWGVSNPPRAAAHATSTYTPPRHADGTTLPPIVSATVGAARDLRPDPKRARQMANGASKAIERRDPNWQRRLHDFQSAAGLPAGEYDGRTFNAFRHFGIRKPPQELAEPNHGTMAAAYPPARHA